MKECIVDFANWIWGYPLLLLLLGGGFCLFLYSRLIPFKYFGHAIMVLTGKYDKPEEKGEINHYQALSTHLASTVGMGNIAGVAIAIVTGGPGAIFWMWVSALVGIATKFFSCSLSIMYRGRDENNNLRGGPMYIIQEGLGKKWKPLAYLFCVAGMIGCLPIFQANQLTQVIRDVMIIPNGFGKDTFLLFNESFRYTDLYTGLVLTILVGIVIFGGLHRIANVASKVVPIMIIIYFFSVLSILIINYQEVPHMLSIIIHDAFSGNAVAGGVIGTVIITGARRAAFSNEAGLGTAPIAHGAAKTDEPIREGLVAMLGPTIDTLIVCTLTALVIMITNVWQTSSSDGVTLTSLAFESAFPGFGNYLLLVCILFFASSSLFSFSWYGASCMAYLVGNKNKIIYNIIYVITIVFGSIASLKTIFSLIDGAFALMSIPTMICTIGLAPKVLTEAKKYFNDLKERKQAITK